MAAAPRVSVLIPTLQAERHLRSLLPALAEQRLEGGFEIRAVDSSSTDRTRELLQEAGAAVARIERAEFGHGRTRNQLARDARGETLVFLTQDALPQGTRFLASLAAAFDDPRTAGAHARILPREDDDPLTRRTVLDAPEASAEPAVHEAPGSPGLRFNDVASAIRRSVLLGQPFPDVPFGEDLLWARAALARGLRIRFVPEAVVLHSHRYSLRSAYARYRIDAAFQRESEGRIVRPTATSVLRGILHEVRQDARFVARHGGAPHLLRSPFLRAAQVLGQRAGSRGRRQEATSGRR